MAAYWCLLVLISAWCLVSSCAGAGAGGRGRVLKKKSYVVRKIAITTTEESRSGTFLDEAGPGIYAFCAHWGTVLEIGG
jgi:hypothetical protein